MPFSAADSSLCSPSVLQALLHSGFLDPLDLLRLSQVCRQSRAAASENDGSAWKISDNATFHDAEFDGISGSEARNAALRRYFMYGENMQFLRSFAALEQAKQEF